MKRVIEFKLFYHTKRSYGNILLRLQGDNQPTELTNVTAADFAAIVSILRGPEVYFDGIWFSTLQNVPQALTENPNV
jgi:hypothetical protein